MKDSVYRLDEPILSEAEIAAARQESERYLRKWKRRALYSVAAFFLSCGAVAPFSIGQSLHAYVEPFGRVLVYLSMALFVWMGMSVGLAINSWLFVQKRKKGKL
jgi:hypothetical protein